MSRDSLPFQYQFMAGAVAGVSELILMYPLDVVKTRLQLQSSLEKGSAAYTSVSNCFRRIVSEEGFKTLYRGLRVPILMEVPKRAVKFSANERWGGFLRDVSGSATMTQSLSVMTGAFAGATESLVVVPFELVKIRLQDKMASEKRAMEIVKTIVRANGLLGLYKGFEATLWRHVIWNAGYFGSIFKFRALLPPDEGKKTKTVINDLAAGFGGGLVGTLLNTPLDVVKTRVQRAETAGASFQKYRWTWPALGTIYLEEGFSALYKGLVPKLLRFGPGGAILMVAYNGCTSFFEQALGISKIHAKTEQ